MPREMTYRCYTCGTYEPHRQPRDDRERNVIRKLAKKRKGNAFVDDYWICVSRDRDCRNIRYAYDDNPFDPPVKMPEPE
ncbi:hypothetical protein FE633_31125 [Streptomyces montanus]|uniref:Uncharacterized protein n=1 Tax=Streptomyces montanus TaxID=2580423 RepID=A0A5R9FF54_9ACTN|nr:hypothetical protein [Streptomyces montanus]TLS42432.1 hypothetical protein FE633_31125 [Streptomyces montanus]